MHSESWVKGGDKTYSLLSDEQIEKIENFMIYHNLKLCKTDICMAAKRVNVPTNRALVHFQNLREEIKNNHWNDNDSLLSEINKIYKKVKKLHKLLHKRDDLEFMFI